MRLVDSVSQVCVELTQRDISCDDIPNRISCVRRMIEDLVAQRVDMEAEDFQLLPKNDDDFCGLNACRLPDIHVRETGDFNIGSLNLSAARNHADPNLSRISVLSTCDGSEACTNMLIWVQSQFDRAKMSVSQLLLCKMDRWFFQQAMMLEMSQPLSEIQTHALEQIVDKYRQMLSNFLQSPLSNGSLHSELESREQLVVWTALCMIYRSACSLDPLTGQYAIGVDPAGLRHLSFSDREAVDAALAIHDYIRKVSRGKSAIFTSDGTTDATFIFARKFSSESSSIMNTLKGEEYDAEQRVDKHWKEVLRKQELARQFRAQLRRQKFDVEEIEGSIQQRRRQILSVYALECEEADLRRSIAKTEQDLSNAEASPEEVIQPLPRDKMKALEVLFFLYMPAPLRFLSRMSFTAQQVTLRLRDAECQKHVKAEGHFGLSWKAFYNSHQFSRYHTPTSSRIGSEGAVLFGSTIGAPTNRIGPKRVDDCCSREDGVWYPDLIPRLLGWTGGGFQLDSGFGKFDPFATVIPENIILQATTAKLPSPLRTAHMQQALLQYETSGMDPTRGNLAIARQQRPTWLSKREYFTFFALRAEPNMQLRKLCCALVDRSLPLAHPAVQLIIRQALYHMGTIDSDLQWRLLWKTDLLAGSEPALVSLCDAVHERAKELRERPRDNQELVALLDITTYIAHWDTPLSGSTNAVRALCVDIACEWAKCLEPQVSRAVNATAINSLRARQTLFHMYAIIAREGSYIIDSNEIEDLVRLMVLVKYGTVFKESAPDKPLFSALYARSQAVICSRINSILGLVKMNQAILTLAVQGIVQRCPGSLRWKKLAFNPDPTDPCWEAVSESPEEHLYNINVLTGVVLFDGFPPCSLPATILQHPLYRRSFGDRDFEVAKAASGVLQSIRPLDGSFYEFALDPFGSNQLLVVESAVSEGIAVEDRDLELLDSTASQIEQWAGDLPVRLRELHSHWYSRTNSAIIFRPRHFRGKDISFILHLTLDGNKCFPVPNHKRRHHWKDLLDEGCRDSHSYVDVLKCWPTDNPPEIVLIIGKFEPVEFIHVYINQAAERMRIELPRYGIEFSIAADSKQIRTVHLSGYRLKNCQQLTDTLQDFKQYLLLEGMDGNSEDVMLIPQGRIAVRDQFNADRQCFVLGSGEYGAERRYFMYTTHRRFQDIRAPTIAARLQLAALYTATSTLLPEVRTRRTGEEFAICLVRRCYVDRPLADDEQSALENIKNLASLIPALYLLCCHLQRSSEQLSFLHNTEQSEEVQCPAEAYDGKYIDMATSYQLTRKHEYCNPRASLTEAEELRILGRVTTMKRYHRISLQLESEKRDDNRLSIEARNTAEKAEVEMNRLISEEPCRDERASFPIHRKVSAESPLAKEMLISLDESFQLHFQLPIFNLRQQAHCPQQEGTLRETFITMRRKAASCREKVESFLLDLHGTPTNPAFTTCYRSCQQLLKASNRAALRTREDFIATLQHASTATTLFGPVIGLSGADWAIVKETVLAWLSLCVLEDKLHRLIALTRSEPDEDSIAADVEQLIIRELRCTREWRVEENPLWLAFEVDAGIQIRPAQASVVNSLLDNDGVMLQLNMGEGKTRVNLPMMILKYAMAADRPIVRVNCLSQLIGEAFDYLHEHLTGGVLNILLFTAPFHRDVALDANKIRIMTDHAKYCQLVGGAMLVTPESRCSLLLKTHELGMSGNESLQVAVGHYSALPWRDIFDECDEILHHKYQKIYAVGRQVQLPSLIDRARAAFMILDILETDSTANELLQRSNGAAAIEDRKSYEQFPSCFRLLPGQQLEKILPSILQRVATAITQSSSYELQWIRRFAGMKSHLIRFMTDPSVDADEILVPSRFAEDSHRNFLLAVRGWLAFGLLEHCLRLRNRVNYGVPHGKGRKKVAIPFRASDLPSERSEFAQPDVTIMLTCLAYYYDGLSCEQTLEAFKKLMSLGDNERNAVYAAWFERSFPGGHGVCTDAISIDKTVKVDLSNEIQRALLNRVYSRNTKVIQFWLKHCLLPVEMMQYPQRIKASAWHLADSNSIHSSVAASQEVGGSELCAQKSRFNRANTAPVGFSGTNDNHRLWPLQVYDLAHTDRTLRAQSGLMLALTHQKCRYFALSSVDWVEFVDSALCRDAVAIIDVGALLAGVNFFDVAGHILAHSKTLRGVVFFSEGAWVVVGKDKSVRRLKESPLQERDCFVIFDEPRCRGADMKLKPDALAVLTLGPGLGKDKFMQAAGRMRGLWNQQKILVVAQPEIDRSIRELNGLSTAAVPSLSKVFVSKTNAQTQHVLTWIMDNTVKSAESGLSQWSVNGLHFSANRVLEDEKLTLDEFYQGRLTSTVVADNVNRSVASILGSVAPMLVRTGMVDHIHSNAKLYGSKVMVMSLGFDEECERELELEQEEEEELEKEIKQEMPADEVDWDYSLALNEEPLAANSASFAVVQASGAVDAPTAVSMYLTTPLAAIRWSKTMLYFSENFISSLAHTRAMSRQPLDQYLHPIDAFLVLRDGAVLVLSNREANGILECAWKRGVSLKSLRHMSFQRTVGVPGVAVCASSEISKHDGVDATSIVQMQLFTGDTMFAGPERKALLHQLLPTREARKAALQFPQMHGMAHLISRSDLEEACEAEGSV